MTSPANVCGCRGWVRAPTGESACAGERRGSLRGGPLQRDHGPQPAAQWRRAPSADRLLLMACASLRFSPTLPDFFTLWWRGRRDGARQAATCQAAVWPGHGACGVFCCSAAAASGHAAAVRCPFLSPSAPLAARQVDKAELAARDALRLQVGGLHHEADDEVAAARLAVHRGAGRVAAREALLNQAQRLCGARHRNHHGTWQGPSGGDRCGVCTGLAAAHIAVRMLGSNALGLSPSCRSSPQPVCWRAASPQSRRRCRAAHPAP